MNRVPSLDYLRGLAAFGIMVFHYTMWTMGAYTAGDFLGRVGVYGVVIFYVLSGITLFHVYDRTIGAPSRAGLADYAIKRTARIFPLLWLMTAATLFLKREDFSSATILLNVTGLFGIYHWWDTVCYGAWSIGNELVFYLFFPLFIFLCRRSQALFALFCGLLLCIFLWFTFRAIDPAKPLTPETWAVYINPLNQVLPFLGGFLIGYQFKDLVIVRPLPYVLIVVSLAAFIFYPLHGDTILLITGFRRVVFTLTCLLLCLGVYKSGLRLPGLLHRFFSMLGEVSYGVYLSHPLVTFVLTKVLHRFLPAMPLWSVITSNIIMTIFLSWVIYRLYEKPFMRLGKYLAGARPSAT